VTVQGESPSCVEQGHVLCAEDTIRGAHQHCRDLRALVDAWIPIHREQLRAISHSNERFFGYNGQVVGQAKLGLRGLGSKERRGLQQGEQSPVVESQMLSPD
jgi:hypothetical protein